MQNDFPLWTEMTAPIIILLIIGAVVFVCSELMTKAIIDRILSHGIDDLAGITYKHFRETRFSNWCWLQRTTNSSRYDLIVRSLNISGTGLIVVSLFIYIGQFNFGIAIGLVLLILYIFCNRTTNLHSNAEKQLREYHSALLKYPDADDNHNIPDESTYASNK